MKTDFHFRILSWPKSKNIAEILEAVNLLPKNALFVDDNPVERASAKEAWNRSQSLILGGAVY
jgi:predicted enzyme involved in methoxymalonyl-ACP biosynthesis